MTENRNPYEGRTVYTERPTARHSEFRSVSQEDLRTAQQQWDEAEATRRAKSDASTHTLMSANESNEEPLSKALENRLRLSFLSTKGATMQGWITARESIIAEYRAKEREDS